MTEPDPLEPLLARIPPGWGRSIDCGAGWTALLLELDAELAAIAPDYVLLQCKEKFGALRYYAELPEGCATDAMTGIIGRFEARSAVTCERCGEPGVLRDDLSWMLTLCDACMAKNCEG